MIETKTTTYAFVCKRCYHPADAHQYNRDVETTMPSGGAGNCRHIVERSYREGYFLAADDASKRVYCGCDYFDPTRVVTKKEVVRE